MLSIVKKSQIEFLNMTAFHAPKNAKRYFRFSRRKTLKDVDRPVCNVPIFSHDSFVLACPTGNSLESKNCASDRVAWTIINSSRTLRRRAADIIDGIEYSRYGRRRSRVGLMLREAAYRIDQPTAIQLVRDTRRMSNHLGLVERIEAQKRYWHASIDRVGFDHIVDADDLDWGIYGRILRSIPAAFYRVFLLFATWNVPCEFARSVT